MNDRTDTPDTAHRRRVVFRMLSLAAFAVTLFGTRLCIIGTYGNATPFGDQWNGEGFLLFRPWLSGTLTWSDLVATHVVHRIVTMRLVAMGLFAANGIWNPLLEMVVNSAIWTGTLAVLVALLDRATGRRHLPLLLGFALVIFGLPYCQANMLWGFQGAFYLYVLWSTLALWSLAATRPFTSGWWGGIGSGLLAFLSLGAGVIVPAAATMVAAIQYATGVGPNRRQLAGIGFLVILAVACVLFTVNKGKDGLGAASAGHMLAAWIEVLGWPLRLGLVGALLVQSPAIALFARMLRRPPSANDPRWFLLALVAGAFGQAATIAYGRASDNCLNPRYLDLYAVGIMVNVACGLAVVQDVRSTARTVAAAVAWTCLVLGSLAIYTHRHAIPGMELRRTSAAAQQANVHDYVLTGDITHLTNKRPLHLPYPKPDRLAKYLDDPVVRSFLPTVVAPPLPATAFASEPVEAFVADAAAPGIAARKGPLWSSHGPAGPTGTGAATITFDGPHRGHAIEMAVAVGGDPKGLSLEIEQDGVRRPVPLPTSPEGWRPLRLDVRREPFTLHVVDRSPNGWIAVTAPVAAGRFDQELKRLLSRWDWFVLSGIVLAMALLVHEHLWPTTAEAGSGKP